MKHFILVELLLSSAVGSQLAGQLVRSFCFFIPGACFVPDVCDVTVKRSNETHQFSASAHELLRCCVRLSVVRAPDTKGTIRAQCLRAADPEKGERNDPYTERETIKAIEKVSVVYRENFCARVRHSIITPSLSTRSAR